MTKQRAFYYAVNPACGHKITVWVADTLDAAELKHHLETLKEAKSHGYVASMATSKEECLTGFGERCDMCRTIKAKR